MVHWSFELFLWILWYQVGAGVKDALLEEVRNEAREIFENCLLSHPRTSEGVKECAKVRDVHRRKGWGGEGFKESSEIIRSVFQQDAPGSIWIVRLKGDSETGSSVGGFCNYSSKRCSDHGWKWLIEHYLKSSLPHSSLPSLQRSPFLHRLQVALDRCRLRVYSWARSQVLLLLNQSSLMLLYGTPPEEPTLQSHVCNAQVSRC